MSLVTTAFAPDRAIVADGYRADQLCSSSDDDPVTNCGVALHRVKRLTTQSHTVIDENVITDYRGLSNDHPNAVIDHKALTDFSPWVDLN
jgi:hypothetical protein